MEASDSPASSAEQQEAAAEAAGGEKADADANAVSDSPDFAGRDRRRIARQGAGRRLAGANHPNRVRPPLLWETRITSGIVTDAAPAATPRDSGIRR